MSIRAQLDAQLRISILRLLAGLPRYEAGEETVLVALRSLRHTISTHQLRAELRWLAEAGLLDVTDTPISVRLTTRGLDVAEGHSRVDGVARLRPDLLV